MCVCITNGKKAIEEKQFDTICVCVTLDQSLNRISLSCGFSGNKFQCVSEAHCDLIMHATTGGGLGLILYDLITFVMKHERINHMQAVNTMKFSV